MGFTAVRCWTNHNSICIPGSPALSPRNLSRSTSHPGLGNILRCYRVSIFGMDWQTRVLRRKEPRSTIAGPLWEIHRVVQRKQSLNCLSKTVLWIIKIALGSFYCSICFSFSCCLGVGSLDESLRATKGYLMRAEPDQYYFKQRLSTRSQTRATLLWARRNSAAQQAGWWFIFAWS